VSVIMPTYQRAQLLTRALRSVFDQDFQDFEIVVIDDGSTDETAAVIAANSNPRLHCIRFESNRGIGAARHAGVVAARGEIVAFLDSDDVWKPGKLATVVGILERHPQVDLVFSDYEHINHITGEKQRGLEKTAAALRRLKVLPLEPGWWVIDEGLLEALVGGNLVGTSSIVALRRSVFDEVGNFRVDLSGPEDLEMWWRAALNGRRFAYTTSLLVERHKDDGSITALTRAFFPRHLRAIDVCEEAAVAAGRDDLLDPLRKARARAYRSMIDACGIEGRRVEALCAFVRSLPHGSLADATRELVGALAGPRLLAAVHRRRPKRGAALVA
jgi:glycosyltransferase involved in cell wall biosynthesis